MSYQIPVVFANGAQKSIDFDAWGGIDGFLAATSGGTSNLANLRKIVPWLNKAVVMTANAVSQLPYEVRRGDTVIDAPWGGVQSPQTILYKVTASLCGGAAYVLPDITPRAIIDLRYLDPSTVTPQFDPVTGELRFFQRSYNGQSDIIQPEDMLYFWLPDDTVEIGAAQVTPFTNAVLSAGLLAAMDSTLKTYGERGFVPPMFAVADGMPNASERERAENVLSSFVRGMWKNVVKILNSKSLVPQKLGAGMEELKGTYIEITRQQIENIAAAFNIPLSLFLSNSANYATSVTDRRIWYESGLFVTLYQTVEDTLNTQLFNKYDLEFSFMPEAIDAFQEEENDKTGSMATLSSTLSQYPQEAVIAAEILGYDLTEEQITEIRALQREPEQPAEQPVIVEQPVMAEPLNLPTEGENLIADEIRAWRKFAERPRKRQFDVKHVPDAVAERIRIGLRAAGEDIDKINAVFDKAFDPAVQPAHDVEALKALAASIEAAARTTRAEPSVINVTMPPINLTANIPQQDAPTVTVNVPEQPAPTVQVKNEIPAPIVNVSAPEVNITNDVKPADVAFPPLPSEATITTDRAGNKVLKVNK